MKKIYIYLPEKYALEVNHIVEQNVHSSQESKWRTKNTLQGKHVGAIAGSNLKN